MDHILFQDVIQPQENRENYDIEIFEQTENEDNMKCIMQNTIYFIIDFLPAKKRRVCKVRLS